MHLPSGHLNIPLGHGTCEVVAERKSATTEKKKYVITEVQCLTQVS